MCFKICLRLYPHMQRKYKFAQSSSIFFKKVLLKKVLFQKCYTSLILIFSHHFFSHINISQTLAQFFRRRNGPTQLHNNITTKKHPSISQGDSGYGRGSWFVPVLCFAIVECCGPLWFDPNIVRNMSMWENTELWGSSQKAGVLTLSLFRLNSEF